MSAHDGAVGWALLVNSKLFRTAEIARLWSPTMGPRGHAFDRMNNEIGSSSEILILRAAIDGWNGHGELKLGRVFAVLDGERIETLINFIRAIAGTSPAHTAKFVNAARERWEEEHNAGR